MSITKREFLATLSKLFAAPKTAATTRLYYESRAQPLSLSPANRVAPPVGMALSRDVLLERVWGYDFLGDSRTVDVHIRWLREKVEPDPSRPVYIQTVRGVGYRFEIPPQ